MFVCRRMFSSARRSSPKLNTRPRWTDVERRVIAARDNWTCYLCKKPLDAWFQIDHCLSLYNANKYNQPNANHPLNLGAVHGTPCHAQKTAWDLRPELYERMTGLKPYHQGGPLFNPISNTPVVDPDTWEAAHQEEVDFSDDQAVPVASQDVAIDFADDAHIRAVLPDLDQFRYTQKT